METCCYYIKKTNTPRICYKNAPPENTFAEEQGLHLCNQHFNMVQKQIVNTVAGGLGQRRRFDFNKIIKKWGASQTAQMNSLLKFRKDEFYREIARKHVAAEETNELSEGEWQNILAAFQILENDAKRAEEAHSGTILPDAVTTSVPERQKECPVCLDMISVKKMSFLECAHALCNHCLRKLKKSECPICRLEF